MSYIETPADHRFPWYVRLLLAKRRYERELEPARLCGRSPKVFAGLSLRYGALDRKSPPIEPALRTLITALDVAAQGFCNIPQPSNQGTKSGGS